MTDHDGTQEQPRESLPQPADPGSSARPPDAVSSARPPDAVSSARPPDPERGLRGVMSAILVFEAVALLLGLTVISNGGMSAPGWQIAVILVLALAHLLAPALIRRRYAVILIFVLQALVIAVWVIAAAIGITGIVFTLVWIGVLLMRREVRKRFAEGRWLAQ